DRSLVALRNVVDRSVAEVRLASGMASRLSVFSLADFIHEIKLAAMLEAHVRRCTVAVAPVDAHLAVDADHDLLASAVGNLLQNAFKFSHAGSEVELRAYASGERILIEVEDGCGGLPPGFEERMFQPFAQMGGDRTGLGLGLSIARRGVEASGGKLKVRDVPGSGCVFTIDLPRREVVTAPREPQRTMAGH
ncbi:MAG TPA: HAMP domain-containing sensor histidine kinase, partial [Myxococcota bacterium]|nr:HAMP domain-containing sensor histidine kinase [Myxococcota bacterium]